MILYFARLTAVLFSYVFLPVSLFLLSAAMIRGASFSRFGMESPHKNILINFSSIVYIYGIGRAILFMKPPALQNMVLFLL